MFAAAACPRQRNIIRAFQEKCGNAGLPRKARGINLDMKPARGAAWERNANRTTAAELPQSPPRSVREDPENAPTWFVACPPLGSVPHQPRTHSNRFPSCLASSTIPPPVLLVKKCPKSIFFLCIRANTAGLSLAASSCTLPTVRLPFLPENAILSITGFFTKNQKGEYALVPLP